MSITQVSRLWKTVEVTPTLDTNAYGANDRVGTVQTIAAAAIKGGKTALLTSLTVIDKASQGVALSLFFFRELPTVASDDNAALEISDAEMAKCVGHVIVATGDYQATSANKVACVKNIQLAMESGQADGNLYVVLMTTGTPTYAASSLVFKYNFEQGE